MHALFIIMKCCVRRVQTVMEFVNNKHTSIIRTIVIRIYNEKNRNGESRILLFLTKK